VLRNKKRRREMLQEKNILESSLSVLAKCSAFTEIEHLCPTIAQEIETRAIDTLYLPYIMDI
jgi:hypothetical protein